MEYIDGLRKRASIIKFLIDSKIFTKLVSHQLFRQNIIILVVIYLLSLIKEITWPILCT